MKRLKNFFDYYNPKTSGEAQFHLAGGELMKQFIETTLGQERAGVDRSKKNQELYRDDPNSAIHAFKSPELNEVDKKTKKKELNKNAVAVIVNNDNKFLLLKRGKEAPWMPSKWSLVGGGIEKDESPQQAIEREILEETGLEMKKFVKTFSIQRNPESIEHVFACRYAGDPTDISLDGENTNYGWFDIDEMNFLDVVPNLIEYITIAFSGKKYD
jgi:8-oxo-dGTP pyrophosphatase MutT (NUDIX family)